MINYYDYDISPKNGVESSGGTATKVRNSNYARTTKRRQKEDEYTTIRTKQRQLKQDYVSTKRKIEKTDYLGVYGTKRKFEDNNDTNIDVNKIARQAKLEQSRKNVRNIAMVGIGFIILFTISYRYALINSKFNEKENLKGELAQIKKENAQVQVSIEQGMNIKNIEKEAQERLGMQKLDTNNKIYVSLPKKDYIESASKKIKEEKNENWFTKLINMLKGN